jgi:hypothetical protein
LQIDVTILQQINGNFTAIVEKHCRAAHGATAAAIHSRAIERESLFDRAIAQDALRGLTCLEQRCDA